MLSNYLKIAVRNALKHKGYSLINVIGLAIGLACCLLIMLWVQDELSYDRFHDNSDRIYRVIQETVSVTPSPLASALVEEIPEIVDATMFECWREWQMTVDNDRSLQMCALAEPSFLDIFSFPFVAGDPGTALEEPFSIVLTRSVAERFFGSEDPIGRDIQVESSFEITVTGVIEDIPENSHMQFDCIVPFGILAYIRSDYGKWRPNNYTTYAMLADGASPADVDAKIRDFIPRHDPNNSAIIHLQSLTDIRLHGLGKGGTITYVYVFSAMAFLVLMIACINFMNLATARSSVRATEVSVRKVVGAQRRDLIIQFMGESLILSLLALLLAVALIELLLPGFRQLSGKSLPVDYFGNALILPGMIGFALFAGITAGSYPALFLSSFRPARILGGALRRGAASSVFRRVFVVIQFALSVFLIIGASVVHDQLDHMRRANLGYNSDQIVCLLLRRSLAGSLETISERLSQHSSITGITMLSTLPDRRESTTDKVIWEGKTEGDDLSIAVISVDYEFQEVFGVEMAQGRYFSRDFATDIKEGFILNEASVRTMGLESPVGTRFSLYGREGTVVGVVEDFHHRSLHYEIEPLVLFMRPGWMDNICIKIGSQDIPGTMGFIEETFREVAPAYPFEYEFLDTEIDNLYKAEERMGVIFDHAALMAVFLSCLGLLGLASFTAEQRTKEIGIRKTFGATVTAIVALLSGEFVKWVAIANLVSWPIAYMAMSKWLGDFAVRTDIEWTTFILAGIISLTVAIFTVSSQAIKAATANPVDSLRHE